MAPSSDSKRSLAGVALRDSLCSTILSRWPTRLASSLPSTGKPKTLARRKPIPLAPDLLTVLRERREQTAYPADSDWVFASPYNKGTVPYWPDSALAFVKPAAVRAEITKKIGWHTFRHTYSTLLRANGTDVKVQSEHSNFSTTLNVYTQAVSDQKRAAHEQIVGQPLPA